MIGLKQVLSQFGAMVGIQDNQEVADFIMQQSDGRAEKVVASAEHQVDKGWRDWAEDLGGKKGPTPQEAKSWSHFLQPKTIHHNGPQRWC